MPERTRSCSSGLSSATSEDITPQALAVAPDEHGERPVAAPHEPLRSEQLQRDLPGGTHRVDGERPARHLEAGDLRHGVVVRRDLAQRCAPALPVGAAEGRLAEVVDDDPQVGQRSGQVRRGRQMPRPRVGDVEREAAVGEPLQRPPDGGEEEEVVARVVVHEVAHAAQARVGLLELPLGHGGVVELHPADDAGDPRMPLRRLEHQLGVALGVLGLDEHRRGDPGRLELGVRLLRREGLVERMVRGEPRVLAALEVPDVQVGVDYRTSSSSHSASGISTSIRRPFTRTCSGVAAPTTTERTAGSRSGNCSAASGSVTP